LANKVNNKANKDTSKAGLANKDPNKVGSANKDPSKAGLANNLIKLWHQPMQPFTHTPKHVVTPTGTSNNRSFYLFKEIKIQKKKIGFPKLTPSFIFVFLAFLSII